MFDYQKYEIEVGQRYVPYGGSINTLTVVDVETFAESGEVIVHDLVKNENRRIDAVTLVGVKYNLV